ncbi:MAG TPA: pectate lyase [Pyrinomonadaceae bacterium]|nr:pectate lyase [Pyrinomonadaceae bacterium]
MTKFIFIFVILVFNVLAGESLFAQTAIIVASDGSGDVKTVSEAIAKVPENNKSRFTIRIKPGIYQEQISIPATKPFVSLIGENAETTKLTFKISNKDAGSTSAAFSFYVAGHDFYAENITFENSFGVGSQAVAVVSDSDRAVFKKCRFLAWQDTLYTRRGRQYFVDSYIEGSVDFIFGQAAAVFENCEIHSKTDGYIAAPMRFAANEPSGLVFIKSKLTAESPVKGVYLGRPWRDYGRTVYLETEMGAHIRPEGWHHWQPEREKTAYFAEFKSSGQGANNSTRVAWSHQLTEDEAKQFSSENFLKGEDGWNPKDPDSKAKVTGVFKTVEWGTDILKRQPIWYPTDEAVTIANQLLLYQKVNGGWEKNEDQAALLTNKQKNEVQAKKSDISETTIDNRTSYTQSGYLAKVITGLTNSNPNRTEIPVFKEAFFKGLDYLLSSQYENGGFPQFFPLKKGYYTHITYNDDAMVGVLEFLRDIANKKPDYLFVDEEHRAKAEKAVQKGIDVILKTQVKINGVKTVWCAQHDEVTLEPAPARNFEPISLSGYESVGIVKFLMEIKNPSPEIIDAIESAIKWFEKTKITGIKTENIPVKDAPRGFDRVVVSDKNAPPLWARFYEIPTNRPIFIGRDKILKANLADIEIERRTGYNYYTNNPQKLLEVDYPKWKEKISMK